MKLVLAVLATAVSTRANIAYEGGLVVKGPFASHTETFDPGSPLYNQLGCPYPGKYPYQGVQTSNVPSVIQNEGSNQPPCGYNQNLLGPPLAGPQLPQRLPPPPQLVFPPEFPGPSALATPPVIAPYAPPAPGTIEKSSHIMKIPRKSDSSITITVNPPGPSNSVYSSPPPSLQFPPRPIFYTRPPPLLASCPAAVFYPATPAYPVYPPPFTCPAHPPYQPPNVTPPPSPPSQPSPTTVTTDVPKNDGKTIASFTSTIPDSKYYNVTVAPDKRDPLLTFKLLSAAAAKSSTPPPPPSPSLEVEAAGRDCSMPVPPQIV